MISKSDEDSAIVVTNDKLIGMWFIAHMPNEADFLQALYRSEEEGKYEIRCRFKYYNSPKPFDPKDRRSVFVAKTSKPMTREEALEVARGAIRALSEPTGQKSYEILVVNGDFERFMEEVASYPWAHGVFIPSDPDSH